MELMIVLSVFLTVLVLALVIVRRRDHLSRQQMVLDRLSRPWAEDPEQIEITRMSRTREREVLIDLFSRVQMIRRLEERLWQAGLNLKASDLLVLMMVLGVSGAGAIAAWSGGFAFPAIVIGIGMALLPLLYVNWRGQRRLKTFDQQLPEILDMLKASLDAGHTLQRALIATVEECADPAAGEFRIVLEQNRLGVPLARALEYMLQRMPDENLRFLVVAIKIQTDVGSSLAGIISQLARTIRDRQRLEMKIRMLTAQPRLGAAIGGLMPVVLLIALHFIHPQALQMLFHDPAGIRLTKAAAVLEMAAFTAIYRMTRMDY
jgi:tight adherence protein B